MASTSNPVPNLTHGYCHRGGFLGRIFRRRHNHTNCEESQNLQDLSKFGSFIQPGVPHGIFQSHPVDIERGHLVERLHLSVPGMGCNNCALSFRAAASQIKGASNIHMDVARSEATLDIDTSALSPEEAIKFIRKKTGYVCKRIDRNLGPYIDIEVNDPAAFVQQEHPYGVRATRLPGNGSIVRLYYDSKVPVRDLVAHNKYKLSAARPNGWVVDGRRQVRKEGMLALAACVLTVPVLVFAYVPLTSPPLVVTETICLILATLVQFGVGWKFFPNAFISLAVSRHVGMDLLIALSTTAAYTYSVVAFCYLALGKPLSTEGVFETSTLLTSFIMLGRYINEFARQKARESVSLDPLQPPKALLRVPKQDPALNLGLVNCGGKSRGERQVSCPTSQGENGSPLAKTEPSAKEVYEAWEIDARLLQHGDVFIVEKNKRVVTDGMVIYGGSEVDESMITGESKPVAKGLHSLVFAGAINGNGILHVQLTKLPHDNTVSMIARMVEDAQGSSTPIEKVADKVSRWFIPAIIFIAIVVLVVWVNVEHWIYGVRGSAALAHAVPYAIATLVISCPCAIGLAVPMVNLIAGGLAAEHGVVFKDPEKIELARKTCHVIFDKTGTLTSGELRVTAQIPPKLRPRDAESIRAVAETSNHPVALAVAEHLQNYVSGTPIVSSEVPILGQGVRVTLTDGTDVCLGSPSWLGQPSLFEAELSDRSTGPTSCVATIAGTCVVEFLLQDNIRPESKDVITALQRQGIKVSILSGDNEQAVGKICRELGIPQDVEHCHANRGPEAKKAYIEVLSKKAGKKGQAIMYVGDGMNDSGALAAATIGVHLTRSAVSTGIDDAAKGAAHVVLASPDLHGVLFAMDISRRAYRRIVFNFIWSMVYNLGAVALASGACVVVRIKPQYAGLGELVSVLPVVIAAWSLRWNFGMKGKMVKQEVQRS